MDIADATVASGVFNHLADAGVIVVVLVSDLSLPLLSLLLLSLSLSIYRPCRQTPDLVHTSLELNIQGKSK
jgi:hypothetical protein